MKGNERTGVKNPVDYGDVDRYKYEYGFVEEEPERAI